MAVGEQAEKAAAARRAAVGRRVGHPEEKGRPTFDVMIRDALQIKIAAAAAVREPKKRHGHGPGEEPQLA